MCGQRKLNMYFFNNLMITSLVAMVVNVTLASRLCQSGPVSNVTAEASSHSVLVAWDGPDRCTGNYRVTLTNARGVGKETRTESAGHCTVTALEPCVAYRGHVSAADVSGTYGHPTPFNVTTDSAVPGPVLQLTAISNDSKSIFVSWDKPVNSSYCVHQYVVVYCYDMFVCSSISTQATDVTVTRLRPCVAYRITVTPKTENDVSGPPAGTEAVVVAEVLDKPANGRVLFTTNFTAALQWDPPVDSACGFVRQIVNCSYSNVSFVVTAYKPDRVLIDNLQHSTGHTCHSAFFNRAGRSANSDEITFRTKPKVPDAPRNVSVARLSASRAVVTWSPPGVGAVTGYRWTVTFVEPLHGAPPGHCAGRTRRDAVTYFVAADGRTCRHEIANLRPAGSYVVESCASNESGFGAGANVTLRTMSSASSPVEDLNVVSVQSDSVVLGWKQPCAPNGHIAFFHSTFVGERVGMHNHIFSVKYDVPENETEFEYTVTNLLAEYKYICSVVAITYTVEIPGQDKRIQFVTPSTSPHIPAVYETFRRLRVTVSENRLTQVRVSIPHDLFSRVNGDVRYYSIIVYQDGGFPDKPERRARDPREEWPPVTRTWAEAAPYPFILAYQTTPDRWMPFKNREDAVYNVGADENCRKNVERTYCNGPLRPVTDYRLKLRAFTADGYQDSWTVPFTTPGESTAVYYLVLCSVIFAVLITATGLYCVLNEKVPWAVKYRLVQSTESDFPGDMNFKQLLAKTPLETDAEYNLLNVHVDSNFSADVAVMPRNKFKNRYANTLPYDYNRVTISSSDNGYINASFIEDSRGVRQYIACQGPMKNTCVDMWKMVLDHDVASIVMLCQTTENDKIKCEKYFPNSKEKLVFGDIQVRNDIMIVDKEHPFVTRILTVIKGDVKKTIRHFQFLDWPDFGIPGDPSVLVKFCQMIQAKSPMGLIVVHCSAGIGRTGTYIACDILMRLTQNKSKLNIFKTVLKLREQRTNMVQTQVQYDFIYRFLSCILKQYQPLDV